MRKSDFLFLFGFLTLLAGPAPPADMARGTGALNLLVYDFAEADSAMLHRAENETSRILAEAGLRTAWHHCTVSPAPPNPGCEAAFGPNAIALRILPRSMARRFSRSTNELSFVAQPKEGDFAVHVMIFFDRVEDLAHRRACSRYVLLSHAMAHEIGHALLGIGSHSRRGIMKAYWSSRELLAASQGLLNFTPAQAFRMRSQTRLRADAQRHR